MGIELFDKRYVYLEWSDELEGKDCIIAKTYQDLKDFVNSGDESRFCKVNKGKEKPFTNLWSECDFCYYDSNLKVKKAWLEGKTIQLNVFNVWEDYINLPRTSSYFYDINWDANEWRVKPSEAITERYYVNIYKSDCVSSLVISENEDNSIFSGTMKQCDYVAKKVNAFMFNECLYRCRNTKCNKCNKLFDFVKNIEFKSTRRMTNRELARWLSEGNGEVKYNPYSIGGKTIIHTHFYFIDDANKEVGDCLIREWDSDEWKEPLIDVE